MSSKSQNSIATQAQEALRQSEEKYRTLFNSMDEGYCIFEMIFDEGKNPVDYRFLEMNPAFENITGLKDAKGKRILEMVPNHEKQWFEVYGKVAMTGEPVRFEQKGDHLPKPSVYDLYAYRFGKPEDRKVAVLFKDITEQKKNRHKNALLSAVINNSDDAIVSKDLNGIIQTWNKAAERLFGYTADEAIGQSITIIIPEEYIKEEDMILSKIRRGERLDHFEAIRQHRDGTLLDVSLTISPIKNDKGKIVGASKIARDITRQRQYEKELEEINETLEKRVKKRTEAMMAYQGQLRKLAYKLSQAEEDQRHYLATELHDNLAQLLAVCKMRVDIMQRDNTTSENATPLKELSDMIKESIHYTRSLMGELKPPPGLKEADLKTALKWIQDKMQKHGLKTVMEVETHKKPQNSAVHAILLQCVQELLFNVVKHAGVNEAKIVLSHLNGMMKVSVTDKGIGFNLEDKQLEPTNDGGFGLFNIRERIDMIGGELQIQTEHGEGTTAMLFVPLKGAQEAQAQEAQAQEAQAQEAQAQEAQAQEAQVDRTKKTLINVMLVDDHQLVREGFRGLINRQDDMVVIAEAENGRVAVEMVKDQQPDIILMDINMPVMDGIEATRQIMQDNTKMCIIGLSIHTKKNVEKAMLDAGACAYLTKDDAIETLCETIRKQY